MEKYVATPQGIEFANYIAIAALEELGLIKPTQEQIDIIESYVLIAMEKKTNYDKKSSCFTTASTSNMHIHRV